MLKLWVGFLLWRLRRLIARCERAQAQYEAARVRLAKRTWR